MKQKIKQELEWFEKRIPNIVLWIALAITVALVCSLFFPVAYADTNITPTWTLPPTPTVIVTPTPTPTPTPGPTPTVTQTPYVTYITPIPTLTPLPTPAITYVVPPTNYDDISTPLNIERIEQGDPVFIGDTYDISGVVGWASRLAWYNGNGPSAAQAAWTLELPNTKRGYFRFYIDPDIFSDKLGEWYQYYDRYEGAANLNAFRVYPAHMKKIVSVNTTNLTIAKAEVKASKPPLPIKHVADYLLARGDTFNISVDKPTSLWLFGVKSGVYDYKSFNGTITIGRGMIESLEPGTYRLLLQTYGPTTQDFTMRYSNGELQWFDFRHFVVNKLDVTGYSPQVLYEKLTDIRPKVVDQFSDYTFELQEPMISISQIDPKAKATMTIMESGQEYIRNETFLDIMGYTNVAPGTTLKFIMDKDKQTVRTIDRYTVIAKADGEFGGNMRWFHVIIPLNFYEAGSGEHFVTATTGRGGETTVPYFIYDMPPDSYVPNKVIKYVAGRIGDTEFVPTPTPLVIEKVVTQKVIVTQTIMIPVTPSNEQVKTQQNAAIMDIVVLGAKWLIGILVVGFVAWYGWTVYKRGKK